MTYKMKNTLVIFGIILFSSLCNAQSKALIDRLSTKIDTILIKKNNKLYFETEYDLENILKFKEVSTIMDSVKTISMELTFDETMGTMLKIFNPFNKKLVYKAELYSYKKKDYIETSTVPVYPKTSSYETWPNKIDQIRLTGFRLN